MKNLLLKSSLLLVLFLTSIVSYSQTFEIRGTVKDADNQVLAGVTVLEKNTQNGVTTDFDGNYTIKVSKNAILQFSYMGYRTQEIKIGGGKSSIFNIVMQEDTQALDEIVVVGYGVQKKSDVTGSVASVKADELEKISGLNPLSAMQGKVAGVQITSSTGSPGAGNTVIIRGRSTVGNSSPLYVVDGLPLGSISFLNTKDIASMEVLKDASATAIYGARGANGVILITTKKAKSGRIETSYDGYYGVQSVWKKPELLNSKQWLDVYNKAQAKSGGKNLELKSGADDTSHSTNWFDEITRSAAVQEHNIRIAGGSEKIKTMLSGNLYDQEGIVKGADYKRYSVRINSEIQLSDNIKIGENIAITQATRNTILENNYFNGIVNAALKLDPITPVKNKKGTYMSSPYTDVKNPVAHIANTFDENKSQRIVGNVYADITILPKLVYHSSYGMDIYDGDSYGFNPTYNYAIDEKNEVSSVSRSHSKTFLWNWINTLTYNFDIDKSSFSVMGGIEATDSNTEWFSASKNNLPSNEAYLRFLSAALGDENGMGTASGKMTEWAMLSYFGRINYNYDERYYLTVNVRHDGSSKFGPNQRWGTFPSVALKWKLLNESFMSDFKEKDWISDLALRAGWGQVGNDKIALYQYSTEVSNNKQYGYVFGKNPILVYGATIDGIGNPNIHWETVESTNIGVDASFFNNKLDVTFDWFVKKTKEMLLREPIPSYVGYSSSPYNNVGDVENKGFELMLSYKNSISDDLSYNFSVNVGHSKNKVLNLGETDFLSNGFVRIGSATKTEVGKEIGAFYGYVTDGLFQDQSEIDNHATQSGAIPGDIRFKDLNGDGKITDADKTFIGSPFPDFTYGLNFGINYKNFDFSMFLQGVQGNEIFNFMIFETMNPGKTTNKYAAILNSWNGKGTSNTIPVLNAKDKNDNFRISDRYIEDGSYLRLRNIQLGYSVPQEAIGKIGLSNLRMYLSAQNLFTFTKYSGLEPEIGRFDSLSSGIDTGVFPHARTVMIGTQITF